MKRHCSVCGLPGHDKRAHIRRNLDFRTADTGVVYPLAGSHGYSRTAAEKRAEGRERTGISSWEQQLSKREGGMGVLCHQRRLENLKTEIAEGKKELNAHPLKPLLSLVSKGEGGIEHIPYSTWNRLFKFHGRKAASMRTARTKGSTGKRGSLRWEYSMDQMASELGYERSDDLRDAIHKLGADRDKLKKQEAEATALKRELPGVKAFAKAYQKERIASIAKVRKARKVKAKTVKAKVKR